MNKYNVLFITVDSWNRNFVGCLNERAKNEGLTPNLDELSKKWIVFPAAFSPSVKTSSSVLSILSGCCPCRYGDWFGSISDKRMLISEILQKNGYDTYGFTSNPCTSSLHLYDKGFNLFNDNLMFKNVKGRKLQLLLGLKSLFKSPYTAANEINSQVFSHLNKNKSPFFVWIHYMDLHGPYISMNGWQFRNRIFAGRLWRTAVNSPEKLSDQERRSLVEVYKEKSKFLDFHIGNLIRQMDDDKTIIIITGDHGDVFGDHGYFGHPFTFYNEMVNVPVFLKIPLGAMISNGLCRHPVSCMDIVPTVVDLLNLNVEIKFDGHSLMPLLEGRKDEYKTKYIISEISREYACVIKEKWKLIANLGDSSFQLYDLDEDYGEKNNLINNKLDIKIELEELIRAHIVRNRQFD
jgi:arylsulfatase